MWSFFVQISEGRFHLQSLFLSFFFLAITKVFCIYFWVLYESWKNKRLRSKDKSYGALECFEVAASRSLQSCLVEIVMKCKIFLFLNGEIWVNFGCFLFLDTCKNKKWWEPGSCNSGLIQWTAVAWQAVMCFWPKTNIPGLSWPKSPCLYKLAF